MQHPSEIHNTLVNSKDLKFCSESQMFEISRIRNNGRLL